MNPYYYFKGLLFPLRKEDREALFFLKDYFDKKTINKLAFLLRTRTVFSVKNDFGTKTCPNKTFFQFKTHVLIKEKEFLNDINKKILLNIKEELFTQFSDKAEDYLIKLIAPNIIGLENIKLAAGLLLFAKDPFHILLLGDPGTGKTEILRSVVELSKKGVFGLGSGTSGVGLGATIKGNEIKKGLLPLANNGIAAIDELNLMKAHDRASLYNAMEKGFITYNKGGSNIKLEAKIRVIASANPIGDRFVGKTPSILKKQLPFKEALLTRFHLIFLLRKPDVNELMEITSKIIKERFVKITKEDINFVKEYQDWTKDYVFPKKFESIIKDFIKKMRLEEKNFLIEITPRTVIGIIKVSKAYSRLKNRELTKEDLKKILLLFKESFYVRKKD